MPRVPRTPAFAVPLQAKAAQQRQEHESQEAAVGANTRADQIGAADGRFRLGGVPLRTLQEWMGHRDFKTTLIYTDYAPSEHEAEMAERAFGTNPGTKLSETQINSDDLTVPERAESDLAEPAP
jgi:site-specific recombinase XerC